MAHTISLLNMKGGVGKTTLAVNLAWHSFRHGANRVLLIDFDPQFNASQYVMDYSEYETHVKDNGTIADLLIEQPTLRLKPRKKTSSPEKTIAVIEEGPECYFHFLPSQLALAHVVKNPAQMEFRLEKILGAFRDQYDYIFIDCAPTDSILTTMALTASNFILVPMRPDRFSILGFTNLIDTIRTFRNNSSDPNKVRELGVVFTQVRSNSGPEDQCKLDVRSQAAALDQYVFESELVFSNTFLTAIQNQTPAFDTKYARDELKNNISEIVKEMEFRIGELAQEEE